MPPPLAGVAARCCAKDAGAVAQRPVTRKMLTSASDVEHMLTLFSLQKTHIVFCPRKGTVARNYSEL